MFSSFPLLTDSKGEESVSLKLVVGDIEIFQFLDTTEPRTREENGNGDGGWRAFIPTPVS